MRYQIPQFIEVEDKIFGPLTIKQFLYVAGGAAAAYITYSAIPIKILAMIVSIPIAVFCLALAFYKVNDRPLVFIIEHAVKYLFSKKLYIWKKVPKTPQKHLTEKPEGTLYVPKLSESKLEDLSWSLDINERLNIK